MWIWYVKNYKANVQSALVVEVRVLLKGNTLVAEIRILVKGMLKLRTQSLDKFVLSSQGEYQIDAQGNY